MVEVKVYTWGADQNDTEQFWERWKRELSQEDLRSGVL